VGVEGPIFCFGIWAEEVDMWVFVVVVVVVVVVHGVNHRKTKSARNKAAGNTEKTARNKSKTPP
jgi:uncharacterized membrane protein